MQIGLCLLEFMTIQSNFGRCWKVNIPLKTGNIENRGVPKRHFEHLQITHLQENKNFFTKFCGKQEVMRSDFS